ncbi:MAG: nucleoside monophosphate kinase [Candidatus Wildermuthbacteria bacterium]|nr:nucleoside monophosphate kinase [Candidatus Wildermuthbacteria bacterium]
MKFSVLSMLGRPGAGKGTQIELLQRGIKRYEVIRTGILLRKKAKQQDLIGKKLRYVLDRGFLVPTPIVFSLWMPRLIRVKNNEQKYRGVVFDGNPRKLYEAQMLDEVFEMFNWNKRFRVCYIRISEKESRKRLQARDRFDDASKEIEERLRWFRTDVEKALAYYRQRGVLIEVNGEQSQEAVHREIQKKLRHFI